MPATKKQILETYRMLGTIRQTAVTLNISDQSVRRILILNGEYTNERAQEIDRLRGEGKSAKEIADILRISRKTVLAYLPYSKTPYVYPLKTVNAYRIKQCRERKRSRQEDSRRNLATEELKGKYKRHETT